MIYFHGTNKEKKGRISKEGFKLSYGRFGEGAYFTSDLKEAKMFGKEIFRINVKKEFIKHLFYPDLKKIYPWISIEEEEGVTQLKGHILALGYLAVEIEYLTGEKELCVYNSNIIEVI